MVTYIYVYQKNSVLQLTNVGLAHAHPNYTVAHEKTCTIGYIV